MTDTPRPAHLRPCGCLVNDRGAHRGNCPDYETIRLVQGTNNMDEMRWERRAGR